MSTFYSNIILVLINFLIYLISCQQKSDNKNTVLVQTKSGPINGYKESFDGKDVDIFLGIPFAEPPVGSLRFRKPEPIKQWTQPLEANKLPNNCHQNTNQLLDINNVINSEDCLYLNIWSPNRNKILKPILVYIHGGAFSIGSISQPLYNGKIFSILGDVVVVTINYRLDAFGFLYTDTIEAPGNMGLWDQVMALKWVNDNIEQFGGNPQNITLMGHSAGSWSTSLHILSPISQNLFQNAILMSGAAYHKLIIRSAEDMRKHWLRAAIKIGCGEDQEYSFVDFTPKILKCLRDVSPQKILEMISGVKELSEHWYVWDRLVVIDGEFLHDNPIELLSKLDLDHTKNIFIGTAEDEGSLMLFNEDPDKFNIFLPKDFTLEEASEELTALSSQFPSNLPIIGEEVSRLYLNGLNNSTDFSEIRLRLGSALGDFYFTCPTIRFAEMLFIENVENFRVYQYLNSHFNNLNGYKWSDNTFHGSDIFYIFGIPFQINNSLEKEKQISKRVIEMLAHFIKHGYPNPQNGMDFKPFYDLTNRVVKPYYQINEYQKPNNNFAIGYKVIECDYLWNDYLDY